MVSSMAFVVILLLVHILLQPVYSRRDKDKQENEDLERFFECLRETSLLTGQGENVDVSHLFENVGEEFSGQAETIAGGSQVFDNFRPDFSEKPETVAGGSHVFEKFRDDFSAGQEKKSDGSNVFANYREDYSEEQEIIAGGYNVFGEFIGIFREGQGEKVDVRTYGSKEEMEPRYLIKNLAKKFSKVLEETLMKNLNNGKLQNQLLGYFASENNRGTERASAFGLEGLASDTKNNQVDWARLLSFLLTPKTQYDDFTDTAGSLKCNESYFVRKGKREFHLQSPDVPCKYSFLGSLVENCTAVILCRGKLNEIDSSTDCGDENDFFEVTDGTGGQYIVCGSNEFDNIPKRAGNKGSDLYIKFKASSKSAVCTVACGDEVQYDNVQTIETTKDLRKIENECVCGRRKSKPPGPRIFNGKEATKFEFPWIAAFVRKGSRKVGCGASLINDRYALTAAHCVFEARDPETNKVNWISPKTIQLIFHSHDMDQKFQELRGNPLHWFTTGEFYPTNTKDDDENSTRADIVEIIPHPGYNDSHLSWDYDVAILKLKHPIPKDLMKKGDVLPICLPEVEERFLEFANKPMTLAGWGQAKRFLRYVYKNWLGLPYIKHIWTRTSSTTLQKWDNVPMWMQNNCSEFSRIPKIGYGSRRHLCAGGQGDIELCYGDSGGPLITPVGKKVQNQYFLAGVVSAGPTNCPTEGLPGVYTNVQEVVQWVYHHTIKHGIFCDKHNHTSKVHYTNPTDLGQGEGMEHRKGRGNEQGRGRGKGQFRGQGKGQGRGRNFNSENLSNGKNLKRQPIPAEVLNFGKDLDEMDCDGQYLMTEKGYLTFDLQSPQQACKYSFQGSIQDNCTVSLLCKGKLNDGDKSTNCINDNDFFEIYDETDGKEKSCGSSIFDETPKVARNNGTDLTVVYKASSTSALCSVFCIEDLDEGAVKKWVSLSKNYEVAGKTQIITKAAN